MADGAARLDLDRHMQLPHSLDGGLQAADLGQQGGHVGAGMGDELGVIAAVVVGGTSLSGGRGSIEGTFVGLLLIAVLASGLNWIGVESFTQQLVLGVVILAAVMLDRLRPQG